MKKLILASALVAGLSSPLQAAPFNPAAGCSSQDAGFCVDYLTAFMTGYEARKMEAQKKMASICVPATEPWEATLKKFQERYAKAAKDLGFRIEDAPESQRGALYATVTWAALSDAYPCK